MPKSWNGKYMCNNYIHPLYNLDGDTSTEEFPSDHPFHRGIFWAWHQLFVSGKRVGDSWVMENISEKVECIRTTTGMHTSQLKLKVLWKSSLYEDGTPFIRELTTITVHPVQNEIRKLDFVIVLKSLVSEVELGGAENIKGYGG